MSNLPFVEEILANLRRFKECVEDGQDVDLRRDRFDLLTQLGLLERVQRSPALWLMTKAGENAIAQPAAGEPEAKYWAFRNEDNELCITDRWDVAKHFLFDLIPLVDRVTVVAPPAAAHGDEYEIWSAAQLAPGEGIEDGAERIRVLIGNGAHGDEAVRKDAERFDWLISNVCMGSVGFGDWWMNADEPASEWRAAIDAAMRAQAGEGGE